MLPLASPGAKTISSRYLQLGTAPVPAADLVPNGPVSRFGILYVAKRWGRQLPAHRPCSTCVLGWLSQNQGLPGCSTSPRPSLFAKHEQTRETGEERCAQCHTATWEQKAAVLDPTEQHWLLRDKPGALENSALFGDLSLTCLVPIFGMGSGTSCLMCGFPARLAFQRCCKDDVFLTVWTNSRASVYLLKEGNSAMFPGCHQDIRASVLQTLLGSLHGRCCPKVTH